MLDASAKLPSGILNGNINQFGDFDQCLSVKSESDGIRGKYCLASFQLSLPKKLKHFNDLRLLMMSNEPYKSDIEDVRAKKLFLMIFSFSFYLTPHYV